MSRILLVSFLMVFAVCLGAGALTGSGESDHGALETVPPTLNSVTVLSEASIEVTFSEPMLEPGVTTPGNYAVSGLGAGTLGLNPTGAAGNGPYALNWDTGEMQDGATVTVMVTGLQDMVGNLISPAHSSASGTGIGVAPEFSSLAANPAQAAAGDTVTITFTASETLNAEPLVSVNGHDAVFVSGGATYTYTYTVQQSDPLGAASVSLTGVDLAGNMGALSNDTALKIIEHASPLPLHAWPAGLALLAAAIAVLMRKRRVGTLLLVVALLASSTAFAQAPTVSNVSFTQSPNGAIGTKVDIYYHLVTSNGPCAILLSLSKDDGDGFSYPVTAYTGDVANMTTGTGHIVWNIAADYPNENIPQARIRVTADDAIVQHTLTYTAGPNGSVSGLSPQTVTHGADGTEVTANPAPGFYFLQWSDASTENPRTDTNVTADITMTASFAPLMRSVSYVASPSAGGGLSDGAATIQDTIGTTPFTVAASAGYNPTGVTATNGTVTPETPSHYTLSGVTADTTVTANFAAITYTVTFDAQGGTTPGTQPATFDSTYGALPTSTRTGYTFAGWYTLATGGTFVTSATTVANPSNHTLYAHWTANTYTVTFYARGGTTPVPASMSATFDSTYGTLATTTRTGYTFAGWWTATSGGTQVLNDTTVAITANQSLYAHWTANTYTVTFDAQSGTTPVPASTSVTFDSTYGTLATTTRTGYTFAGWLTATSGGTQVLSSTTVAITANQTLYACWTANTYTVTFDAQSGTTPVPASMIVTFDSTYGTLATTSRTNYTFAGWWTAASDGTEVLSSTPVIIAADQTLYAHWMPPPMVASFVIDSGAATTTNSVVTLNNTATNSPTDYMASEASDFSGASWTAYSTAPSFTLFSGIGTRTVYLKARNGNGESGVVSDTIFVVPNTVSVGAGTFTMGRTASGDDTTYGTTAEDPQHQVTLGAYQIGTYHVTNREYCDVLNWALAQGYLKTSGNAAWAGTGNIYAGGNLQKILAFTDSYCNIQYSAGVFSSKTRAGLPGTTNYSMDTHPVGDVTWFGSVAFCNWLSQWQGLTPCYDMTTANWPLTVVPPTSGGYRLPTEAEWERAAAWDGSKHWIYGFMSDTLTGNNRCNYNNLNPFGLTSTPYTSLVGWFNGVNVSPNGSVTTVNSVSSVGAYDMSGEVWQWCHDWYSATYYSGGSMTNPTGPASGTWRVVHGGSWNNTFDSCRAALRAYTPPTSTDSSGGFRVVRTP